MALWRADRAKTANRFSFVRRGERAPAKGVELSYLLPAE